MAVLLLFCTFLSIACGVKSVGIQSVLGAFVPNGAPELEVHIVLARVPRTVFGVLAGAALGMSGPGSCNPSPEIRLLIRVFWV